MCSCVSELKEEAERVQTQHRSEKQRRKETELKVNTMEEELQDLKTDKESLERVSGFYPFVNELQQYTVTMETKGFL